jgi:hypothetical protein
LVTIAAPPQIGGPTLRTGRPEIVTIGASITTEPRAVIVMCVLVHQRALVAVLLRRIDEADAVPVGRAEHALARVGRRRLVLLVPQEADDVGVVELVLVEGDQHLVADQRHHEPAALGAGHRRSHRQPLLARLGRPRQRHLHAAEVLALADRADARRRDPAQHPAACRVHRWLLHRRTPVSGSSRRATKRVR